MSILAVAAIPSRGVTPERAGLCVLAVVVVGRMDFPSMIQHLASSEVSLILTYAAAAAGAAGAMFVKIAGRLVQHRQVVWMSAALALYSVVVVPVATAQTAERAGMMLSAAQLVAYWTVVALVLLAVRPRQVVGGSTGWALAGCGLFLTLIIAEVATLAPGAIPFARSSTLVYAALIVTA